MKNEIKRLERAVAVVRGIDLLLQVAVALGLVYLLVWGSWTSVAIAACALGVNYCLNTMQNPTGK